MRQYFFVGGMPEAVLKYIETGNMREVREVQREILETYSHDMTKHSKSQIQRIHQVWQSIPAQLARENKKFFYGSLRKSEFPRFPRGENLVPFYPHTHGARNPVAK